MTGSFDAQGGNVLFPGVPTTSAIAGDGMLPEAQRAKALGLSQRPLGPSRWEFVTSDELYTADRALPSLRRFARDPEVELHPDTARARGIQAEDWVLIETPEGSVRARARLNADLDPNVVCGQHGWWQACEEIGAPGYDPFGPGSANLNRSFVTSRTIQSVAAFHFVSTSATWRHWRGNDPRPFLVSDSMEKTG